MSNIRLWALALALAVVWTAGAAALDPWTTTWHGECDGEDPAPCTNRPDKWECYCNWEHGVPNGWAEAIIPQGFTNIVVEDRYDPGPPEDLGPHCASIQIASGSVVTIKYNAVLTIWNEGDPDDSQIDGTLQIEKGGELAVYDERSVTIKGDGGQIKGLNAGGTVLPLITGYSDSPSCSETLTIEDDGAGGLDVHGRLDIQVELVNEASVIADDGIEDGMLVLSGCAKSGAGSWAAENDGKLQVDIGVTGAGTWGLEDDMDAEIEFNVQCTSLTGRFTIKKGKLYVNANILTVGGLTFQSVNGSNPRIDIAEDKSAYFRE